MGYPSFVSGDVLNASDMNAVGLWLVKTQTVGTGVSSVTVTGAFSATYDYYKITYTGGTGSAQNPFNMTLGSTTTGYYWGAVLGRYDNAGSLAGGVSNGANWSSIGFTDPIGNLFSCELTNPFLTLKTGISALHWDARTGGGTGFGVTGGHLANSTSYTAFTLGLASGTMTGGIIRVYGYRN
jgi:hypothetical protein